MFKKTPILKYEPALIEYQDIIAPAKKFIPDWYKKIIPFKKDGSIEIKDGIKTSLKNCVQFLDSLTTGYIITLPYDLYVKNNDGDPYLFWRPGISHPPTWREEPGDEKLIPHDHHKIEYIWDMNVALSVPEGYSFIFTHPLNRNDLPFTTITGIVDGGLIMNPHGNIPFYIKKGFEGMIPQGTPIAQIIPFRQENWKSEYTEGLLQLADIHMRKSGLTFIGWYKKTFWVRKQYD